jgi:Fe-S-cluster containining protein
MKVETDVKKIEAIAKRKSDENWRFRTFLKGYDAEIEEIDAILHEIYEEVASLIDCRECANCCRKTKPILRKTDIDILSRGLGISADQLKGRYLIKKEDPDEGGEAYTFKHPPCPFLKGNLCTNYDSRPEDCRSYPHLQKDEFVFRLFGVIDNYAVCPIVFNVYERLKARLR